MLSTFVVTLLTSIPSENVSDMVESNPTKVALPASVVKITVGELLSVIVLFQVYGIEVAIS